MSMISPPKSMKQGYPAEQKLGHSVSIKTGIVIKYGPVKCVCFLLVDDKSHCTNRLSKLFKSLKVPSITFKVDIHI